jgi:hypothetical protein
MANYYESARTNYFRVKDKDAFKKFIDTVDGTDLVTDDKDENLFALLFTEEGVPSSRFNEETEDYDDFDLMDELAPYLADGSVAILMGAGAEKLRHVNGYAVAINNKGESVAVNLDDIYEKAKSLGHEITQATY